MYYKLATDRLQLTTYIEQVSGPTIPELIMGRVYDLDEDEIPARFTSKDRYGNQPPEYIGGDCLFSKRLVAAIESAGVDNLQKIETEIQDEDSGEINRDFCLVNIIGLVAAADMSASDALPLGEGHVFTHLKIDPGKPRGLLMFRLAESLIDVIVHEQVAKAIEDGGFRGVLLSPVSDS